MKRLSLSSNEEHVSDVDALIDSWIEVFEMQLGDDGSERAMRCRRGSMKFSLTLSPCRKKSKGLGKK